MMSRGNGVLCEHQIPGFYRIHDYPKFSELVTDVCNFMPVGREHRTLMSEENGEVTLFKNGQWQFRIRSNKLPPFHMSPAEVLELYFFLRNPRYLDGTSPQEAAEEFGRQSIQLFDELVRVLKEAFECLQQMQME